ncbi:site-specific recombinase XerD [Vibrio crassostreae]|uniref:site-specific integrase n=1 Tax=Vibrio crassostreae TaxID=246167 RepID=UPI0010489247|nr:site-specific integrase [Vibrio crassostreae]TCT40564.1 site-specific recombinase XerD [Vibrio crassostreae]
MHTATNITLSTPTLETPIPVCIEFYIHTKAQYHKSYLGSLQYRLARISSWFSAYSIRELTLAPSSRSLITQFIDFRLKKVKSGTVRKDASTLQAMINWLRKDIGLQIPDIFKQIRIPSDYGVRSFVPTEQEVYDVISHLQTEELRDAALLLAETACRRNEILKLQQCDIFLKERFIHLRNTKNGEDRKVPLSSVAVSILRKRLIMIEGRAETYPVFSIMPEYLSKQFRKAADEAGLGDFVLHTLRHYRLSSLIAAGHDAVLVSKVSGHKDHRMLNRYIKLDATALAGLLFD